MYLDNVHTLAGIEVFWDKSIENRMYNLVFRYANTHYIFSMQGRKEY